MLPGLVQAIFGFEQYDGHYDITIRNEIPTIY